MSQVMFVTTVDSVQKLIWKTVDFSKTFKDWLPHLKLSSSQQAGNKENLKLMIPTQLRCLSI